MEWTKFWANEREAFIKIMTLATGVFAKRFLSKFGPVEGKTILDYGCGPGLLADALQGSKSIISGADINSFFLTEYQRKHPEAILVHLKPDHESIGKSLGNSLHDSKFDYIILLSITQYFKNSDALRETISTLCKFIKPNGRIILADVVPLNHSALSDGLSLLKFSLRKNYMLEMALFLKYLFFSSYRKHAMNSSLLKLSQLQVEVMSKELGLTCTQVSNLTMHSGRLNFILQLR
jgi:2-polyprenyl-3-methyl-5-hydroxy-6-metoxy-1,4-benzoquinol methylase